MDFVSARIERPNKNLAYVIPVFNTKTCKDLMIRGHDFYAVWDEEARVWSTNQDTVIDMIDQMLIEFKNTHPEADGARIKFMKDSTSGSIDAFHHYVKKQATDNYHQLDSFLVFANDEPRRELYSTRRLPYAVGPGDCPAYDEIMETLYSPTERHKIEWCIGAVLSGDSKKIQKFLVFYGAMGTGKSTVLNIIQMLFDGYYAMFDAESLGNRNASFALEQFKNNPLVAIQHDGDLSHIESNARLNSIISHEEMTINEKFKSLYSAKFQSFLFMGTNRPVKITDAKSGILRRLIDVHPTGERLPADRYNYCMERIAFELGAIADRCLRVYISNKKYYDTYVPLEMMGTTNDFYNFMEENYDIFAKEDCVTLKTAWAMYKEYVDYAKVTYPMTMRVFASELGNYFKTFESESKLDGVHVRRLYSGFRKEKFDRMVSSGAQDDSNKAAEEKNYISGTSIELPEWLRLRSAEEILKESSRGAVIFDELYKDCKAQYAVKKDTGELPKKAWDQVTSKLSDIDTSKVHFVMMPDPKHICIDFDLKDENGNKSLQKNLEAAAKFPPTYAEVSKGGGGLHLHYIYEGGDPEKLSRVFEEGIEIKVFTGKSSLRRRLSLTNGYGSISTISSGLPLKGEDKVVNWGSLANEKAIRTIIKRNLQKEYFPSTKQSVEHINKTLDDAYNSGMHYDVTDLRTAVLNFAIGSTNHSQFCIGLVNRMKWKSEEASEDVESEYDEIIFFDVEVFPNLFVVCWKKRGAEETIKMINPKPYEIEELCRYRLVGFNNRGYDNHILYAWMLGYSNKQLYDLSQRIINNVPGAKFGEAYNMSYADIWDYASNKQSLKKWEIELGIHHQELGLPWDKEVDESLWDKVAEYCVNDVEATEAVFNARKADFIAREILADLSGLTIGHTTQQHITKIIFGGEKHPKLQYTDLSTLFPGYEFCATGIDPERYNKDSKTGKPVFTTGKSIYMGEDPSEGGFVFSRPGMYENVWTFDVAGMHPASILALNKFGDYTDIYRQIRDARIAIKHHDFESARKMLDGKLAKYLTDEKEADKLSKALKLVLNSTYGYCSASFECPFKDPRDVDNIVAKRGALFMITLKNEVVKRGFEVIHCKTDSIKIVNPTKEIHDFVFEFGKKYGYDFEIEAIYKKICLVNRAVYVAKEAGMNGKEDHWTATGTQFQVPYIFKTLFSHEPLTFDDYCETKSVKTAMYLDMGEGEEHDYHFVGKCGQFCPIKPGRGGGKLLRIDSDYKGKYSAVTGTKDYYWLESEVVRTLHKEDDIDDSYYIRLADEAVDTIREFGDAEAFMSD